MMNVRKILDTTADDWSAGRPRKELWVAAAKPDQAVTLVLSAVPLGWTATIKDERLPKKMAFPNLNPGEVRALVT